MFSLDAVPWPRVPILAGPTPVQRVGPALWVKREDLAGEPYGGNKVRKLEWLLGDALESGGDILSMGAIGSHHLLATAVYGAREGIRVHGVVFPQSGTPYVEQNARALHAWATKLWPAGSGAEAALVWARAGAALRAFNGFAPVRIPLGGSNVLGTAGWVGAGLEIAAQVRAGEIPEPERVVVPLGTGGTTAGLWLGLRLAGLKAQVVAVRVTPLAVGNVAQVQLLARRTRWRLRREAGAPKCRLDGLQVVDRQFGAGYGLPTEAAREAVRQAADLGLSLETTYSGKAFAEALAEPHRRTLFVATANSRPLAPLLASALDELPAQLKVLLTPLP